MRFLSTLKEPELLKLSSLLNRKKDFKKVASEHNLGLLFVYGSLAQDQLKPLSDLDFAVLSEDNQPLPFKVLLSIIQRLQEITQREDIDLVDLAKAPPLLKMEILRKGKQLYVQADSLLNQFSFNTIGHFLDTQPLRDNLSHYLNLHLLKE